MKRIRILKEHWKLIEEKGIVIEKPEPQNVILTSPVVEWADLCYSEGNPGYDQAKGVLDYHRIPYEEVITS